MLIICNFIRAWWNHHYSISRRESRYDDYEYYLQEVVSYCRIHTTIRNKIHHSCRGWIYDNTGHVVVNYWYCSVVFYQILPPSLYSRGNKQHLGIDNTQQRRHLSVENAVAVDNECVPYAYEYNNQPRGIDWYPIDKSFLAERAFTTQQLSARDNILYNNNGGVVVYSLPVMYMN